MDIGYQDVICARAKYAFNVLTILDDFALNNQQAIGIHNKGILCQQKGVKKYT